MTLDNTINSFMLKNNNLHIPVIILKLENVRQSALRWGFVFICSPETVTPGCGTGLEFVDYKHG